MHPYIKENLRKAVIVFFILVGLCIIFAAAKVYITAIILAIFAFVTANKKSRIDVYNGLINDLDDTMNQTHELTIEYWASGGRSADIQPHPILEAKLLYNRLNCSHILKKIKEKQCILYRKDDVEEKLHDYFKKITGGSFQQKNKKESPETINKANFILRELKSHIETSKIPYSASCILFIGVK